MKNLTNIEIINKFLDHDISVAELGNWNYLIEVKVDTPNIGRTDGLKSV